MTETTLGTGTIAADNRLFTVTIVQVTGEIPTPPSGASFPLDLTLGEELALIERSPPETPKQPWTHAVSFEITLADAGNDYEDGWWLSHMKYLAAFPLALRVYVSAESSPDELIAGGISFRGYGVLSTLERTMFPGVADAVAAIRLGVADLSELQSIDALPHWLIWYAGDHPSLHDVISRILITDGIGRELHYVFDRQPGIPVMQGPPVDNVKLRSDPFVYAEGDNENRARQLRKIVSDFMHCRLWQGLNGDWHIRHPLSMGEDADGGQGAYVFTEVLGNYVLRAEENNRLLISVTDDEFHIDSTSGEREAPTRTVLRFNPIGGDTFQFIHNKGFVGNGLGRPYKWTGLDGEAFPVWLPTSLPGDLPPPDFEQAETGIYLPVGGAFMQRLRMVARNTSIEGVFRINFADELEHASPLARPRVYLRVRGTTDAGGTTEWYYSPDRGRFEEDIIGPTPMILARENPVVNEANIRWFKAEITVEAICPIDGVLDLIIDTSSDSATYPQGWALLNNPRLVLEPTTSACPQEPLANPNPLELPPREVVLPYETSMLPVYLEGGDDPIIGTSVGAPEHWSDRNGNIYDLYEELAGRDVCTYGFAQEAQFRGTLSMLVGYEHTLSYLDAQGETRLLVPEVIEERDLIKGTTKGTWREKRTFFMDPGAALPPFAVLAETSCSDIGGNVSRIVMHGRASLRTDSYRWEVYLSETPTIYTSEEITVDFPWRTDPYLIRLICTGPGGEHSVSRNRDVEGGCSGGGQTCSYTSGLVPSEETGALNNPGMGFAVQQLYNGVIPSRNASLSGHGLIITVRIPWNLFSNTATQGEYDFSLIQGPFDYLQANGFDRGQVIFELMPIIILSSSMPLWMITKLATGAVNGFLVSTSPGGAAPYYYPDHGDAEFLSDFLGDVEAIANYIAADPYRRTHTLGFKITAGNAGEWTTSNSLFTIDPPLLTAMLEGTAPGGVGEVGRSDWINGHLNAWRVLPDVHADMPIDNNLENLLANRAGAKNSGDCVGSYFWMTGGISQGDPGPVCSIAKYPSSLKAMNEDTFFPSPDPQMGNMLLPVLSWEACYSMNNWNNAAHPNYLNTPTVAGDEFNSTRDFLDMILGLLADCNGRLWQTGWFDPSAWQINAGMLPCAEYLGATVTQVPGTNTGVGYRLRIKATEYTSSQIGSNIVKVTLDNVGSAPQPMSLKARARVVAGSTVVKGPLVDVPMIPPRAQEEVTIIMTVPALAGDLSFRIEWVRQGDIFYIELANTGADADGYHLIKSSWNPTDNCTPLP